LLQYAAQVAVAAAAAVSCQLQLELAFFKFTSGCQTDRHYIMQFGRSLMLAAAAAAAAEV
jgi:hypothetical protein